MTTTESRVSGAPDVPVRWTLDELKARVRGAAKRVAAPHSIEHPSARVASELGLTVAVGRIGSVGRCSDGSGTVGLYVEGGSSYGSEWPGWAFEVARDALLHGKQIRVIANGEPFGENLILVSLRDH